VSPKLYSALIHPIIQQDKLQFAKAKTLLILLLFFLVVLVGYSSFFALSGVYFDIKALLNYLGLIAISSCLLMLKWSTSIQFPLRVLSYFGVFLVSGGVYWSGGFASNDILWYLVSAISSLLFIGKTDGIIVTVLSLLAISCFYFIDITQIIDLPLDPITQSIHYRFANAVVIITIIFFLALILVRNNLRLQKIVKDIQASQIRESISQDFHDELGNKLASVIHLSKRLQHSKSETDKQSMLQVIGDESQAVYDSFRDFIWVNNPESLSINSLFMYLTDFNHHFFSHTDVFVDGQLISNDKNEDLHLSPVIIRHLVPLFKELMTNIHKHAQATKVEWSLTCNDNEVILKIIDDGKGFNVESNANGEGLKNIQKRADEIQANWTLHSALGEGTHSTLHVNLLKTSANER
jgi:signal transduction histidine kinase